MDSIAFASMRAGRAAIYLRDLRRGTDERLFESENSNFPSSWSGDGALLAYTEDNPQSGNDIWVYSLNSESQEPFLATSYSESNGEFSPDGRFIAYESDETGRQKEVYIRPYPQGNPRLQVSTDGGRVPRWGAGGSEIYYWVGGRLMAVPLTFDPELTAGTPTELFEGSYGPSFDVAPDGRSFLMTEEMADTDPPMRFNFVANWFEQLKLASRAES
jgi:Tol biopolymer transport system component